MRVYFTSYLLAIASLAAGYLVALATGQVNSTVSLTLFGLASVVCGGGVAWQVMFFKNAIKKLEDFSEQSSVSKPETGFLEFDQVAAKFAESLLRADAKAAETHQSATAAEQLELSRFVSELEKKHGVKDSSSDPIARLNAVVGFLENRNHSGLHQAIACSREIGKGAQQLVVNADEQSDAVNRITDVIEMLSGEIMNLGENAESAVESSATAQQFAVGGLGDFEEIVKELEKIKNHVSTRERKLQLLSQHSREIGNIVQGVGTLSSRTDLLALNASIESARAGEFGRGFALVAEEVRELAEQSAQSVSDISSKVDLIQQETQDSISVAFGEHEQINSLIQRLRKILEAMRNMSDASSNCAEDVVQISNKTQQQLQMMTQIVGELESSSAISKANRIHAEGVHWTAKTLEQLGEQMGEMKLANIGE